MEKIAKSLAFVGVVGISLVLALLISTNLPQISQFTFGNDFQNSVVTLPNSEYSVHAVSTGPVSVSMKTLQKMGIEVLPGAQAEEANENDPRSLNQCVKTIVKTLQSLPREHTKGLKRLTLSFDPEARRGLAGGDQMIIRCANIDEDELMAVVIHEVGHVVDTGSNLNSKDFSLKSSFTDGSTPIYVDDPSVKFYETSFLNNETRNFYTNEVDFVSGYAMSDPFEDFAETYLYYVLHGNAFRKLKVTSAELEKKYSFMKERVFENKEYDMGEENVDYLSRIYDGTQMKFSVERFLNY